MKVVMSMSMVISFFKDNLSLIISIILVIISFIVSLCRKRPKMNEMDNILLATLEKLPEFIRSAETFKGADVKKTLVLESVKTFVKNQFSVILSDQMIAFIGYQVEQILSTPQKKEITEVK